MAKRECCSTSDAELVEHVMHVHLHRRLGDEETLRDLGVRKTVTDECVHLALARRERRYWVERSDRLVPERPCEILVSSPCKDEHRSFCCAGLRSRAARRSRCGRYAVTTRSTAPLVYACVDQRPEQDPTCPGCRAFAAQTARTAGTSTRASIPRDCTSVGSQRPRVIKPTDAGQRQARDAELLLSFQEARSPAWWLESRTLRPLVLPEGGA